MATVNAAQLRKIMFQLHLWVALILFLPLVPLGLTGSALMMPDLVEKLTNPVPHAASAVDAAKPVSAYLDAGRAALPAGARITALKMPTEAGRPVEVQANVGRQSFGSGRSAWLDPATAEPIKVTPTRAPLFAFSHDFHGAFMVNGPGRKWVGWAGVAMTFLALSGIWLWWPRGPFMKAFAWRRTPDTMNNLHHLLGFWISVPLFVVSLTGVFIAFPSLTNSIFGAAPGPAGAARPAEGAPTQRGSSGLLQSPDQAVAVAIAAHPGASLVSLAFPGAGGRPGQAGPARKTWRVELSDKGATTAVQVDDATGEVRAAPPQGARGGGQTGPRSLIRPLHEGLVGGIVWQWLVFLAGLLPLVLAFTGVYLWARNELRKSRARQAAA